MIRRRFNSDHDVYGRVVVLLYGTWAEINDALTRETGMRDEFSPSCLGGHRVWKSGKGRETDYVCIMRHPNRDEELATLAHEVLHHTCYTMQRAGVRLNDGSEEAYAYYMSYVFRNCVEVMRRAPRRR